jgi:hypothetical protein
MRILKKNYSSWDPNRKLCSDGVEQWVPYDNTNYCSTSAFDGASSILQEVYSSLKTSGIVVEQVSDLNFCVQNIILKYKI